MVVSAKSESLISHKRFFETLTSDLKWNGSLHSVAVSGTFLVAISDRLDVERQERDAILDEIAKLHASKSLTGWERLLRLKTFLCRLAEIAAAIRKFSRLFKAVKKEMRRRQHESERAMYCGVNFRKRVWFLLHGSHPPRSKWTFTVASFGEMI